MRASEIFCELSDRERAATRQRIKLDGAQAKRVAAQQQYQADMKTAKRAKDAARDKSLSASEKFNSRISVASNAQRDAYQK